MWDVIAHHFPRPVLVVDDDDATRAAEHAVLEDHGFRVVEARDGAEAMRALQQDPRREADRCNAEAYLAKPFDARELVQVVKRFST